MNLKIVLAVLVGFVVIALFDTVYIVRNDQQAIIIQLGELVSKEPVSPGLNFKLPFIQKAIKIEKRIIGLPSDSREVIALDQKRLIVNYFSKYKIIDPVKFYESTRSESNLESRIRPIIESQMREQIGMVPLAGLLTEERSNIMTKIQKFANEQTLQFGVSVVDVRIKRTDLPEENSDAVFRRMQTDREKEAKEIRAQGFETAKKIKAKADKEYDIIIAEASKLATINKGEGEAESARILNKAFGENKDFFEFYRLLELYKKSFTGENTKIILSDKDDLLKLFYSAGGKNAQ